MVIMLAGRQGLIGDVTQWATGDKLVFAYSMAGLFMGYVYFSIPARILTVMATAEKLDPRLEEAARSLGASPWRVIARRHHSGPEAGAHVGRRHLLCHRDGRLRHRLHARDAHQCAADGDLHRVHAEGEHRGRRRACRSCSGAVTWLVLAARAHAPPAAPSRQRAER